MPKNAGLQSRIGDTGCFDRPEIIISTHVDDIAGYGSAKALSKFKSNVGKELQLDKLRQPAVLLGMELTWHNTSVK